MKDFNQEIIGYQNNIQLLEQGFESVLPESAKRSFDIYRSILSENPN